MFTLFNHTTIWHQFFTKEDGLYNIGGTGNLYFIFLFEMDQTRHYPLKELCSVGDPDPDPQDPHVFGPPGSGSISQRCGSGSFPFS